jgi:hypothetical protein
MVVETTAMHKDAVSVFIMFLARCLTREEVSFVTECRQHPSQFRDVNTGAAHMDRIERLPGK